MMGRQQHPHCILVLLLIVFIIGIALSGSPSPRRSRVRRQNMKVRINATGDTIVMKFLRPNSDTKLEGYILGYGSSMFSKQFIQLPENGQPYETEFDAEPKYLIAVQPIPVNEVKKQCTGKVELEKPLHLVIGSVTPTSVLLSWGTLLKTPYESNVMNDCVEDGHYTVRYRERNRKWNYQTCPTSDTVIDHLKPNTVYEFGVQPNTKDRIGSWSKPVLHNISSGGLQEKAIRKIFKPPVNPVKPLTPGPLSYPFAPRHVPLNRTQGRVPLSRNIPPKTTLGEDHSRPILPPSLEIPLAPILSPLHISATMAPKPVPEKTVIKHGYPLSNPKVTSQSQYSPEPQPNPQSRPEYSHPPQSKPRTPKPQIKNWSKSQPSPQSISQHTAKARLQTTSQPIPHTHLQMQPKPESQSRPQTKPHSQPKFQRTSDTESQPQTRPTLKPILEQKPKPQPTSQHTPKTQPQPLLELKPKLNIRPQPRPESKPIPQIKPQPKPESKPVPHTIPQTKPESKPVPQIKPQPKPESKPIPQIIPRPKPESKPIPQNNPIPSATSQPKPGIKPRPQPDSKSVTQTKPSLQPESQPIPWTKPQPQPESKPIPQTKPKPKTGSKPTPQTKPKPKPGSKPIPQNKPQPQPTSQPILLTQPYPQPKPATIPIQNLEPKPQPTPQSTSQILSQTQSQGPILEPEPHPEPTYQITRIKPKPQPTSQFNLHIFPTTQAQTKPLPQSKPQTTTELPAVPKPQVTPQINHQVHPRIQPHFKTQTQSTVRASIQPIVKAYPQTPQPALERMTKTQNAVVKDNIKLQAQPQSESTTETQAQTRLQQKINQQPQPTTNPETRLTTKQKSQTLPTPKPKTNNLHPKPKKQLQTKGQPKSKTETQPKSQPKPQPRPQPKPSTRTQPKPQPRAQQPNAKTQQKPQSQHPIKTQTDPVPHSQPILLTQPPKDQSKSQVEPLPEPHPASRPQQQSQPGLHSESQSRSYSGTTEVTPRKTVTTAPSPPEEGKPLPRPALDTENADSYIQGAGAIKTSVAEVPKSPISSSASQAGRNSTLPRNRGPPNPNHKTVRPLSPSKTFTSPQSSSSPGALGGVQHRGNALPKPAVWPGEKPVLRPSVPVNKRPNLVAKPSDHDKPMDLKQGENDSILKPFPVVTAKPKQERRQQTTTSAPSVNSSRFDVNENSSIFRPLPASEVDIMGKKRYVAPHVIYKTDKKPDEPCSITSSLAYFPDEEGADQNVTGPPRVPPSNLTVVTVEGCPSFVILDWQKSDNETREYEVVSTTKGPNGEEVSVLTTNQTHTAVENLKPESSYEFKVTPRNEMGTGPSSDPVSFNTESADPRVSENVSGKDAIWTQFPFKADSYSECNGKMFVKRTWYRKFVGIQLCNSLRYKIYLSDSLNGKFYNIGDQTGHGEDHCQFVDSFLDGRTGTQMLADQLPSRLGYYRALRQEPVHFGEIGGKSHVTYVGWYECGTPIPGKW
ncbi:target of Nesh-SH3 isoform X1 [Xyrichtys novacula]|uniref:Target of Nesh-SH3 isoform X1 n=1 Tax=Xyrichtys novacula TaxID=13765 RepID=A0AAV1H1L9_XYRNO|nr:target of Nesh-SH3 isoform X1 [Xyrichtys novacula]